MIPALYQRLLCGLLLCGACSHCYGQQTAPPTVNFCELVKHPELYNGKEVTVQAQYVLGYEWSALLSGECTDQIWLEWRGLDTVAAQTLKQAYDATYFTVPVYLTVQGIFASGSRYGHLGAYSHQIEARKVLSLLKISAETHMLTDAEGLDWKTFGSSLYGSLNKSWIANMPDSVQNGQQGKNSVTFRVLQDGSVPDDSLRLISASGISQLDEASVKAIRAASPFSRLPGKFSGPSILLCTIFYYNPRTNPASEGNPYFKALFASIAEMDKTYATIDDSMGGSRIRTDYHHMLVQKDPQITEGLPEKSGGYQVEYVETGQLIARFKKLGREFSVLKIQPATTDSTVQVSLYWVSYKKGKLNLALSDWSDVGLQYDCEKQFYVVTKVKLGGV